MLTYSEVMERVGSTVHLLIGNGFSISCDRIFSYENLYDKSVNAGLSTRAQQIFTKLGTNNFEAVMRLLDDGNWLSGVYELVNPLNSEMSEDLDILKKTLVSVIASSHISHSGLIDDTRKRKASAFFKPFTNIFCTNYDLLAYWIVNWSSDPPEYQDGFRADNMDPTTLVFSERTRDKKGLFYIHGGLHLFNGDGGIRKYSYKRAGQKKSLSWWRKALKKIAILFLLQKELMKQRELRSQAMRIFITVLGS